MRTIGMSPMEVLVLPRVLAAVIAMPLLGFYAIDLLAIIGGGLLCWIPAQHPAPSPSSQRLREVIADRPTSTSASSRRRCSG